MISQFGRRSPGRPNPMLAATAAVIAVTTACASGGPKIATPLPAAPEPAVSPPAQARPAGVVVPLTGTPEGVAVGRSRIAGVNVRNPDGLVLFDLATPRAQRFGPLGGSARHLFLGGP